MCTLVAMARLCPGVPIVIAANRDEFCARTAAPPAVLVSQPDAGARADLGRPRGPSAGPEAMPAPYGARHG
jgi:uncharacterized protein with NRDE domain